MSKQLQFEIWQECNSLCKFCYLGTENRCTPDSLKISALEKIIGKISDLNNYPEYDTLSYLGGEFFQGQLKNPEVKDLFMQVMRKTAWLLENKYIKNVWLYATLTIGDQQDLYEVLELFKNKENFWILTSYDTMGRFHTDKMFENWDYHMKNIHSLYPAIKFNTTTILSGDCIEKYLNDELSFKKMMIEYHTTFFFKQCGAGAAGDKFSMNKCLPNFFPTRAKFLEFLRKFSQEESEDMWDKLFNIQYRADTLYRNFNDTDKQMALNTRNKNSRVEITQSDNVLDCITGECGHLISYQAYIDSDKCVLCDKNMIINLQ